MVNRIKTAAEHRADIRKAERDKAEADRERAKLESYQDLRDDCMSLVKNSGLSFREIHGRLGPHPHTLELWATKVTSQPRLGKMRATLRIIGYDIGIVEREVPQRGMRSTTNNIVKLPVGKPDGHEN
jgi:hypothetical protein